MALWNERFFAKRGALADGETARRILFRDGVQPLKPADRLWRVGESKSYL